MDRKDHQIVRALMHDGRLSNQDLAAAVNLSERSLRRHLAEAGSGYRRLIEEHSAERAAALLRSSERSVAEVADQLGFSDASNFSKAFKSARTASGSADARFSELTPCFAQFFPALPCQRQYCLHVHG